ncbi:hypothetical protein [Streptomyces sp. NPDC059743]|uniref:hypothetical protein n=1 Tax=Streptomyces sp. NPDC059743 TaxID=3346928 RepID=UPI00365B0C8B
MNGTFAVEIQLLRPARGADEATAAVQLGDRYALRVGHARAVAVLPAANEALACAEVSSRASAVLPVDVVTSLYPDAQGQVWLTFVLPDASAAWLRDRADAVGQTVDEFLGCLLREATDRVAEERSHAVRHDATALLTRYGAETLARALLPPWQKAAPQTDSGDGGSPDSFLAGGE